MLNQPTKRDGRINQLNIIKKMGWLNWRNGNDMVLHWWNFFLLFCLVCLYWLVLMWRLIQQMYKDFWEGEERDGSCGCICNCSCYESSNVLASATMRWQQSSPRQLWLVWTLESPWQGASKFLMIMWPRMVGEGPPDIWPLRHWVKNFRV